MKWFLAQLCLYAFVVVSLSHPSPGFDRNRRGKLCGRQLSQALALVCESVYFTPTTEPPRQMRAQMQLPLYEGEKFWMSYPELTQLSRAIYEGQPIPHLPSFHAKEEEHFVRLTRQGIVDECCHKSCGFSELRAYCGGKSQSSEESNESQT